MTSAELKPERPFIPVRIALMTVSTSRTLDNDKSGDTLQSRIEHAGHKLAARTLVKDDVIAIRRQARAWLKDHELDVIISTGGTGLTGDDVTIEAMRGLFEKEIEGFSVAFHMVSFGKIGTSSVQSRATAGVAKGKYIFCLPGSPAACRDGWDQILKYQLDYRHTPCNFVEIMPRLEERLRRK
jgi:molybdenum cofactor biosynthesis protein B